MTRRSRLRHSCAALLALVLATVTSAALLAPPAIAAEPVPVADALTTQDGSIGQVRGYVVGQPVSTTSVVTDDFPTDYALALADSATETDPDAMLFVQVPDAHRSQWGLASHPELLGDRIEVTGTLDSYFAHPGLIDATAFGRAGETPTDPPEEPGDPDDPGEPTDPGIPAGYYDPAAGKTGAALRTALNGIIDGHTELSYDEVWDALQQTDEDPADPDHVLTVYSRLSLPKSQHGGDADDWNREHTWAKSHGDFGTSMGPGTDVHHLMPEDASVNSTRSNLDFDTSGGSVDQCPDCAVDDDSFEPPDDTKGDIARAMFYMAIRYEGADGHPDLELNDQVDNGSAPYIGRLSVLLAWHDADPPSAFEVRRNNLIYENWQGNRNPFVDHPEWATAIWN